MFAFRRTFGHFNLKTGGAFLCNIISRIPILRYIVYGITGLKRTGGYCPCRLEQTEDTKCMCKEFKEQIADPNFEGFCHCMLYYKSI